LTLDETPDQPPSQEASGQPPASETPPSLPFEAAQQPPPLNPAPETPAAEPSPPGDSDVPPPPLPYPVAFDITGPDRLSRLSTFFRLILLIPLSILVAILSGGISFYIGVSATGGLIFLIMLTHWLTVLMRGRPVSWLWGTIVAMQRFVLRSQSYFLLMTDRYPPFEGDWFVGYEVEKPERIRRRTLLFWKTFASIPHFLVLSVLAFGVAVCTFFAWFAILFTGRYPRGLRNFVEGWLRWGARVTAYWMSLRDEFPPYSLSATAGVGSRRSQALSAFGGIAVIALVVIGLVFTSTALGGTTTAHVSYSSLTQGRSSPTIDVANVEVALTSADDNYTFADNLFQAEGGTRFVKIQLSIFNQRVVQTDVTLNDFQLEEAGGKTHNPTFASLGGLLPPRPLASGRTGNVTLIFEVTNGKTPVSLRYSPPGSLKTAEFIFN
jgi:hypothetical protein